MKKHIGFFLVVFIIVGLLVTGCRRPYKSGKADKVKKLFTQAQALFQDGNTNAAINVLSKALDNKVYKENRAQIFNGLMNMLLTADRADDAKTRYLEAISQDEKLARAGFGIVYDYYIRRGDRSALIKWTKKLIESQLPERLTEQAFIWHMKACYANEQFDQALELVPVCVKKFSAASNRRIFGNLVESIFDNKKYSDAARLLDAIAKESTNIPELQHLVDISRIDLSILRKQWRDAEQKFMKVASGLTDGELSDCLHRTATKAIADEKFNIVDRLCNFVLKNQRDKEKTKQEAAIQWLTVAEKQKAANEIPRRLKSLSQFGFSPRFLSYLYKKHFYFVVNQDKKKNISKMINFGEELAPNLTDEKDQSQLKTMILDGTFIIGDYKQSLKILKQGIPTRKKEWHEMAISKVKAHKALKEGNKKQAVRYFREFMSYLSKSDEQKQQDPSTGIVHTKEMILGFNAKRIGDILNSIGDKDGSQKAYKEAREHYKNALKEIKPDSKQYKLLQAEMAEVPVE